MELLGQMGVQLVVDERMKIHVDPADESILCSATWSRPCVRPSSCWARWWPDLARRKFPCPVAAPSARVQSTCTSRGLQALGADVRVENGYIKARAKR